MDSESRRDGLAEHLMGNVQAAGKVIYVDSVNGNDTAGRREREDRPFATVGAALAAAVSGDIVLVRPGTYDLPAGITIPSGVILSGLAQRTVTLRMLGVTADTTLVTMGNNSTLSDVTLQLTTTGAFALTGVLHPNSLTGIAPMINVTVIVTKTVSADAASVTGILVQTPVVASAISKNMQGGAVSVSSTGTGNNRGILQNTGGGTFNCRQIDVSCTGSGSTIGVEVNQASAIFSLIGGLISGDTADVSRTAGTIELGTVNLRHSTTNGKSITATASSHQLVFGEDGGLVGGVTRFMRPGSGTSAINEIQIEFERDAVIQKLVVKAVGGHGLGRTDVFTVRKNGVDTLLKASLVDAATSASDLANAVSFAATDKLSIKVLSAVATGTNDVYVNVEVY